MNILVDARSLVDPKQGGVARVARSLVRAYAEQFPEDTLTCITTGSRIPHLPDELSSCKNIVHEHIRIPNKLWSVLTLAKVTSLAQNQKKCDGVFLPNIGFIGELPKTIPTTLLVHDLSFLIEPKWFSWKQRAWHDAVHAKQLIRSATKLLAVSETTKRDAKNLLGIPEEKIRTIPIGISFRQGGHIDPPKPSIPFVLCLGAGDPRKNVATAIEAVRVLRADEQFQHLELVLVGNYHANESWIRVVSRPSDEELSGLYATAGAFFYPSWYEGYGLPLHEAASFGTPCIASTSGALPETAPVDTRFANPAKPHHWVEALREALTKKEQPTLLESSGRQWKHAAHLLRESFR